MNISNSSGHDLFIYFFWKKSMNQDLTVLTVLYNEFLEFNRVIRRIMLFEGSCFKPMTGELFTIAELCSNQPRYQYSGEKFFLFMDKKNTYSFMLTSRLKNFSFPRLLHEHLKLFRTWPFHLIFLKKINEPKPYGVDSSLLWVEFWMALGNVF